jgi:nucleotide-binding universal stress UspA family protein
VTVLLVDVANTLGARPDGWWRDRAGATARLLDRLALLPGRTTTGPDGTPLAVTALVAVVEGRARDVAAPAGVRCVRAPGSGDDALVQVAVELGGADLLVVTADRGLRARLPAGARSSGPGWLLAVADRAAAGDQEQDRRP